MRSLSNLRVASTFLPVALAAVAFACGSSSDGSPRSGDDPSTDASTPSADGAHTGTDAGPQPGDGAPPAPGPGPDSLTIHIGGDYQNVGDSVHVILGDGSQYILDVPNNTPTVTFEHVSLPQDVSIIEGSAQSTRVITYAGIDTHDLWMDSTPPFYGPCPCTAQGDVTGHITGTITKTGHIDVVGDLDYFQAETTSSDGQYSAPFALLPAGAPNAYDLIAFDGTNAYAGVASTGVKTGLTATGSVLANQDIALDHPFDQAVPVTATGDTPFGGANFARLSFYSRGKHLYETYAKTKPFSVASPTMDSGLAIIERRLEVEAGQDVSLRGYDDQVNPSKFYGVARSVLPSGASGAASFPTPGAVTSPTLGTLKSPGTANAAGLTVAWSHDPSAAVVEVTVWPNTQGPTGYVYWTAYVPSSRGSFKFFSLPSSATPSTSLPTGNTRIQLHQLSNPSLGKVSDLVATNNGPYGYLAHHATTETFNWGFLNLQ